MPRGSHSSATPPRSRTSGCLTGSRIQICATRICQLPPNLYDWGKEHLQGKRQMRVVSPGVYKARTEVTALMLMEAHAIGEQFLPFAKERGIIDVAAAYQVQD